MPEIHEGGCVCGAVRYRVRNKPVRTTACHCSFCQRRTGSAFGIGAYFREQDVEIVRGTFDDPKWLKIERHTWMRSARRRAPHGARALRRCP